VYLTDATKIEYGCCVVRYVIVSDIESYLLTPWSRHRGRITWGILKKTASCKHACWRRRHARDCVDWQICVVIRQVKYVTGRAEESGEGDIMWATEVMSCFVRSVHKCEVQTKKNEKKSI